VAADLDALLALFRQPEVRRFLFDDREATRVEALGFLESSRELWRARGYGFWVVHEVERVDLAGFVALQGAGPDPALIYGMSPGLWGRGYVSEAAAAVLTYAFETLRLPRVVADVDRPNLASVRVLEKVGMTRTREARVEGRPILYYALDREAYLLRRASG
jgi:ribosomal-protein-alanine N-acetyltransferase